MLDVASSPGEKTTTLTSRLTVVYVPVKTGLAICNIHTSNCADCTTVRGVKHLQTTGFHRNPCWHEGCQYPASGRVYGATNAIGRARMRLATLSVTPGGVLPHSSRAKAARERRATGSAARMARPAKRANFGSPFLFFPRVADSAGDWLDPVDQPKPVPLPSCEHGAKVMQPGSSGNHRAHDLRSR